MGAALGFFSLLANCYKPGWSGIIDDVGKLLRASRDGDLAMEIQCFRVMGLSAFLVHLCAMTAAAQQPAGNVARAQVGDVAPQQARQQAAQQAPQQPFAPLTAQQQQELDQVLIQWQNQSRSTRTLDCKFERWRFDLTKAPVGVHAHKAEGQVKYAAPDKGLFRVDSIMYYNGMKDDKPIYAPNQQEPGEYWVCTGKEVVEYDRGQQVCKVNQLPADMQGQQIFNSPLPFVFNLDANGIKERFWVRTLPSPKEGTFIVEAWPKKQNDRGKYKLVQVVLDKNFNPQALIMYAPNFHPKNAPEWDHYEFSNVKRNSITATIMKNFLNNFIPKQPPSNWKVQRDNLFTPPQVADQQPTPPRR